MCFITKWKEQISFPLTQSTDKHAVSVKYATVNMANLSFGHGWLISVDMLCSADAHWCQNVCHALVDTLASLHYIELSLSCLCFHCTYTDLWQYCGLCRTAPDQHSHWHVALWRTATGDAVLERSIENRCIENSEGPATQHANLGTEQVVSLCSP